MAACCIDRPHHSTFERDDDEDPAATHRLLDNPGT